MNKEHFKNINLLIEIAKRNNFVIFDDNAKSHNLNIWIIRNKYRIAGKFDDMLLVFWRDINREWKFETFDVTADPSEVSLMSMKNKRGVAIIKKGQYRNAWKLGLHRNSYPALVQRGNITVIRDFNKDNILDIPSNGVLKNWYKSKNRTTSTAVINDVFQINYYEDSELVYRIEKGSNFGINCHRASKWKILQRVGLYSEGCVVHQDPYRYEQTFMPIINSAVKNWGNSFSFVLCDEEDLYI